MPLRPSLPDHEYEYGVAPPDASAVQVTSCPIEADVGETKQETLMGALTSTEQDDCWPALETVMVFKPVVGYEVVKVLWFPDDGFPPGADQVYAELPPWAVQETGVLGRTC